MNSLIRSGSKKGLAVATLAGTLLFLFVMVRLVAAQGAAFNGEIMDEACAKMGSHDAMIKSKDLKTKDACVLYCAHSVTPGSKYVLYDAATKNIYQLDDQSRVEPYVAEKVQITGTLNAATKTIKVTGIKVP